jgi:hypothetical protein
MGNPEDQTSEEFMMMTKKLIDLFQKIRETAELELMTFDTEELEILKIFYGEELIYPLHGDVTSLLSGPTGSDRVH